LGAAWLNGSFGGECGSFYMSVHVAREIEAKLDQCVDFCLEDYASHSVA